MPFEAPLSVRLFRAMKPRRYAKRNVANTARVTALVRALGHRVDGPEANGDDLAERCLPPWLRGMLATPSAARLVLRLIEHQLPGSYGYFNARTQYFDQVVAQAAGSGLQQLVLLGAGFDTRPQRFAEQLQGARIFEVDMPVVLAARVARLRRAGLCAPNAVEVPIDFDCDDLVQALTRRGYETAVGRTLFLWEGVTYYLSEQAVAQALRSIAALCTEGSGLVFDYVSKSFVNGDHSAYGSPALARGWRRLGNVNRSGVASVGELVEPLGFRICDDVGAAELERRYLHALRGGPRRALGALRMAYVERIRVPGKPRDDAAPYPRP